ncbi:MAG: SDR family oxidoreductase [Bdellovibrionota bacterium]
MVAKTDKFNEGVTHPDMNDAVVLVTGGGRGIGAATAKLFARCQAKVMLMSRSAHELARVVSEIKAEVGESAHVDFYAGDVSSFSDVQEVFSLIEGRWGSASVLVNNAATIQVEPIESISLESWQRTLDVNVTGAFLCAQRAFKGMRSAGRSGAIVNLSSLGGISGTEKFTGFCSYSVSKFALIGMTETMAVEGREWGIRVNAVAPGAVATKMLQDAAPFLQTKTVPEDIARIILFLADSSQSGAISGAVIPVYSNIEASG